MNSFSTTKSKINPKSILGGMIGSFEEEENFEQESSFLSSVFSTVKDTVTETVTGVVKETASSIYEATVDAVKEVKGAHSNEKFPSKGSIEFNQNQAQLEKLQKEAEDRKTADKKKIFFQTLKEDQQKVQIEKDRVFEEEINDIISNLPTEQKNRLLHYQASYKDKSIYQRAELRKKLIEEQQKAENQEKAASIPSPAKQPSAMEGAFEGRSGSQGSGTANLSAQAVG